MKLESDYCWISKYCDCKSCPIHNICYKERNKAIDEWFNTYVDLI